MSNICSQTHAALLLKGREERSTGHFHEDRSEPKLGSAVLLWAPGQASMYVHHIHQTKAVPKA